jgi:hypothetical protein
MLRQISWKLFDCSHVFRSKAGMCSRWKSGELPYLYAVPCATACRTDESRRVREGEGTIEDRFDLPPHDARIASGSARKSCPASPAANATPGPAIPTSQRRQRLRTGR